MPSASENVRLYIKRKPCLQEALEKGVINYSALARLLSREGAGSFDAVKAALRRIGRNLAAERKMSGRKVLEVLRGSRLEVRNRVMVVTTREKMDVDAIASAKGSSGFTYIVDQSFSNSLGRNHVIKIRKNLAVISITSPEKVEETPGVVSYLLSTLAAEDINVVEFFSCYRDTVLVFDEGDVAKAFDVLSERMDVEEP